MEYNINEKNDEGRIKAICMRLKCHAPIWIREYTVKIYNRENPLFCAECWYNIYAHRDLIALERKKESFSELKEIEKELIPSYLDDIQP